MAPITRKTLNNTQNGGTQLSNISEDLEKTLSDTNSKIDSEDDYYADCDENDEPADTSDANCPKCKVEVKKDDPALQCEICSKWFHNSCIQSANQVFLSPTI